MLRLDLTVDITTDDSLRMGALQVLAAVKPAWEEERIHWKIYTDGITNKLIGGWLEGRKDDIILVRVYGEGTEKIIDRQKEMQNMKRIEELGGSKLYASFNNGISYEFISGEVLTQDQLWDEDVWSGVARMMAELHRLPLQEEEMDRPCMWDRLNQFINCCDPTCRPRLNKEFFSKQELFEEVKILENTLGKLGDTVVFCHNDILLANVIIQPEKVRFIDLEYGAPNYAAFDIANHFCEFAGCDGKLDFLQWIPGREWQLVWLREYLAHREEGRKVSQTEVEELQVRVEQFILAAHLQWAIWAVIQAENSTIHFDFEDYALQKLKEFKRWKLVLGRE